MVKSRIGTSVLITICMYAVVNLFQNDLTRNLSIDRDEVEATNQTRYLTDPENIPFELREQRKRCQIIYVLGVEGTVHHGVLPVISFFAENQIDSETGIPYEVQTESDDLRYGLFSYPGSRFQFQDAPPIDHPILVRKIIKSICPDNGKKHVIIEGTSFPSGGLKNGSFKVGRQKDWRKMSPEAIANSWTALNHPTNLYKFYNAYHPYAEVRFIILHRPFLETVASHAHFDGGVLHHAKILMGYTILLSRFLRAHRSDKDTGENLWMVISVEKLSEKFYQSPRDTTIDDARNHLLHNLATFLNWPNKECSHCFYAWVDSTTDNVKKLAEKDVNKIMEDMKVLRGIWPPDAE